MADATPVPPVEAGPSPTLGLTARRSAGWTMVNEAYRAGQRVAAARRERVLKQPDLARLLCEPPLSLPTPEMWTGYIPPAEVPNNSEFRPYKPNKSPIRRQLIEVCNLVAERESAEAEAPE